MIKRNFYKAIISSIISLLPIVFGMIFWDSLPDVITTHFGSDGTANGFSGKGFAVFFMPLFMFVLHWICIIITAIIESKEREQNDKVYGMLFFICPVISLFSSAIVYSVAFELGLNIGVFISLLFGVMFSIMGNYIPKTTRNRTVGIKVKWTLANDNNWAATHRFAGRLWFFGGFLIMLVAFVPAYLQLAFLVPIILFFAFSPMAYSYLYYKNQVARGEMNQQLYHYKRSDRMIVAVCIIFLVAALGAVGIIMITGDVTAYMEEEYIEIIASYYEDAKIDYKDIDSLDFRESGNLGTREFGFGSPRLSIGSFKSGEFGSYTRYTYTNNPAHIIITVDKKTFVLNLETAEETKALYDKLELKLAEISN